MLVIPLYIKTEDVLTRWGYPFFCNDTTLIAFAD